MSKKLEIQQIGGGGDVLTAEVTADGLYIECDEPWAGDTETGIGRSGAVTLTKEQARQLADFLFAWVEGA